MHGLGGYCAKLSMADREKQILYDFTYIWNLKKRNKTVINIENRLLPEGKGLEKES